MISRRPFVLVLAAALSIPAVARAQIGGSFCFPGSFQACGSVTLQSVTFSPPNAPGSDGFTTLVFRVVNFEGQQGVPSSGAYGIYGIGIDSIASSCPANGYPCPSFGSTSAHTTLSQGAAQYNGGNLSSICVVPSGCGGGPWDVLNGPTVRAYAQGNFYTTVIGCGVPTYSQVEDYSTCAAGSFVDIAVRMIGNWTLLQASHVWVAGVSGDFSTTLVQFQCTIGVDCVSPVPEPVTIALMGTGLLGIGGVRLRRKKDRANVS